MLAIILLLTLILLIILQQIKQSGHRKRYRKFYQLPSPFYVPILGHTYNFIGINVLKAVLGLLDRYGKAVVVYVPHRSYITANPEEMKIILNQTRDKSVEYNHLQMVFGESLLLASGAQWKKSRKLLSKTFKQNILDSFVPKFYLKSTMILDELEKGDYEDVFDVIQKATMETVFEGTIGVDSSILEEIKIDLPKHMKEGQQIIFGRVGNIFKMNDFVFSFLPEGKKLIKAINESYNFIQIVIDRKKQIQTKDLTFDSNHLPLLDHLLHIQEKEKLTEEYIKTEIAFFAAAATDTTAYTVLYACLLIAMNPDVQERIYNEINSVMGQDDIDAKHLHLLKYTEMSINETLRLIPVVPQIGRQATTDIDVGSCIIPKDTSIIISFLHMHRNEEIYPNPLVFDPDRFLPENIEKRHPYSFLPFSGGPRNCLGWKYAQMAVKTILCNIVRKFYITTKYKSVTELDFESNVVMMPTHPLDLHFHRRDT